MCRNEGQPGHLPSSPTVYPSRQNSAERAAAEQAPGGRVRTHNEKGSWFNMQQEEATYADYSHFRYEFRYTDQWQVPRSIDGGSISITWSIPWLRNTISEIESLETLKS